MAIPHRPPDVADAAAALNPLVNRRRVPPPRSHYYGQPTPKPAALPWWLLGPAALRKQAAEQASAYYKPALDELHAQQTEARNQAAANLRAVQALIAVVQGQAKGLGGGVAAAYDHAANADYGPSDLAAGSQDAYRQEGQAYSGLGDIYAAQAGLAGQGEFLNTVQDSNKISRDLLSEIAKVTGEIPGATAKIYDDLLSQQDKYKTAQQKAYDDRYDRQYRMMKDQAAMLNKGPWLYYVADTPQGPQVVLAKDKKGRPISTDGMSDYQKASLEARAAASAQTAAYNAAQVGLAKTRADQGQQRIDLAKQKAATKAAEKKPKVILSEVGTPLTKGQIKTYIGDTHVTINNHAGNLEALLADLKDSPIPRAIWAPIVARKFQIPPWVVKGTAPNPKGLRHMAVPRLHRIAVFLGYDAPPLNPDKPWIGKTKQELIDFIVQAV